MSAGRSSVDIALYTLIPVMVVMMVMMKYLESVGVLAKLVNVVAPVLKPFGLTGLSLFCPDTAQLCEFRRPVATLAMMEKRRVRSSSGRNAGHVVCHGASQRALSAGPIGTALAYNGPAVHRGGLGRWGGNVVSARRRLASKEVISTDDAQVHAPQKSRFAQHHQRRRGESIRLSLGAVPMLILSLTIVGIIKSVGAFRCWNRPCLP